MNRRFVLAMLWLWISALAPAQLFSTAFARNNAHPYIDGGQILAAQNAGFAMLNKGSETRLIYVNRLGSQTQNWPILNAPNTYLSSVLKMAMTTSGEVYVVGYGSDSGTGDTVAIVHKFSRGGTPLWSQAFLVGPGSSSAYVTDAVCDRQGHLLICGFDGNTRNPIVLRANSDGTAGFNRTYSGAVADTVIVGVAENSSIHLAHWSNQSSGYMRLRGSDGLLQAQRSLPASFTVHSMAAKGQNVYLAGGGFIKPTIVAINVSTAASTWTYEASFDFGYFNKVVVDGSGSLLAAGDAGVGIDTGALLVKVSASGTQIWQRVPVVGAYSLLFTGLSLDKHNEAYLGVRQGGQSKVFKYGPTGSFRFSIAYPSVNVFTEEVFDTAVQPVSGLMGYIGRYENINSRWLGWYQPALTGHDAFTTPRNTPLVANAFANDRHIGDVPATVSQGPAHGALTLNGTTGAFSYTPASGYSGPDSFVYRIQKPGLPAVQATVAITVTP